MGIIVVVVCTYRVNLWHRYNSSCFMFLIMLLLILTFIKTRELCTNQYTQGGKKKSLAVRICLDEDAPPVTSPAPR